MPSVGGDIVAAIVAFAATNVDDFAVLLVFFARAIADKSGSLRTVHVIVGQLLGFSVLVALSLIGLLTALFVPAGYLALIGVVPILIGGRALGGLARKRCSPLCSLSDDSDAAAAAPAPVAPYVSPALPSDEPAVVVVHRGEDWPESHQSPLAAAAGAEAARVDVASTSDAPAAEAASDKPEPANAESDSDDDDDDDENCISRGFQRVCAPLLHRGVLEVAVMTIANGGDNIAVYLPLFAAVSPSRFWIYLIVFYALVLVWCVVSWGLLRCKPIAKALAKHSSWVVPFLLMALGAYIVSDSVVFHR